MALTKAKITNSISEQTPMSKAKATEIMEVLLEIIKRTIETGEDILISGFGKFTLKDKRKRRGRNPATGDDLILDPRRIVSFKCSKRLREKINHG